MKYALVCKNEPREQGYRVAEVADTKLWEAAPEHEWIECDDNLLADQKWFDPSNNTFKDFPKQSSIVNNQPTTSGTQAI